MKGIQVFSVVLLTVLALTHTVNSVPATYKFLCPNCFARFQKILDSSWNQKDLASLSDAVLGYKLLGKPIPTEHIQGTCTFLAAEASKASATTEELFYASSTWKGIGTCSASFPTTNVVQKLKKVASDANSSLLELYYATQGLKALDQRPVDVDKLITNVQSALKKDDGAQNLGYAFHIASALDSAGSFAHKRIRDAIEQADEVDGKYLRFDGLSNTALVITGAYSLGTAVNSAPALTHDQVAKFANYFLSRNSVQTSKGVYNLLEGLTALATNKFQRPVAITLHGSNALSVENPKIQLKVIDVFGKPIGTSPISVTLQSAVLAGEKQTVISNKKFEASSDKTVFALNLLEEKLAPGQYVLSVTASLTGGDSRFPVTVESTLNAKITCAAAITSFEIGTADADQTTQPKMNKVVYPSKLSTVLEADSHQKVVVRFQTTNSATEQLMLVQQAFLRLSREEENQEIIFNAERDSSKYYKFDIDVGAKSPEVGSLVGQFRVDVIIGDAVITNPVMWHVADLRLSPSAPEKKDVRPSTSHADLYKPKPEIQHMFREPEKRPPAVVSNLFTVLVCLPLLVLLILWGKLGINISNFPCSLSALGFHLGLAGIFALFAIFWLQLNMFITIKYLIGIGAVTFLSGNKLLASIASKRKAH